MYLPPEQVKGRIKNIAKKKPFRRQNSCENLHDGTISGKSRRVRLQG